MHIKITLIDIKLAVHRQDTVGIRILHYFAK